MVLKSHDALSSRGLDREITGDQRLVSQNRKVDLNSIEPTGMHRQEDENKVGPLSVKTVGSTLPVTNSAVIHNPEDAPRGAIGGAFHHGDD